MLTLDAAAVREATPWSELIEAIAELLAGGTANVPQREMHDVGLPDGGTGSLLVMPAWLDAELLGVKAVTYFPSNAGTDLPTISAGYLLFDGRNGQLRATLFVDTLEGAVLAGDLAQPLASGVISSSDIAADLASLVTGSHSGRTSDAEITLFKSVGFALSDLAAARLVHRRIS